MMRWTLVSVVVLSGCGGIIGGATADLNRQFIIPELMASGDVGAACAAGEALGGMVSGFAPYSRKAEKASVLTVLSAGMCLEGPAWDAELRGIAALRERRVAAVKDADIEEQRLHAAAATRYLEAFERLRAWFPIPEPGEDCPKVKPADQLTVLMGLSAGLLAVLHDGAAEGAVGVPMDIPAAVLRGSRCLDNETWWGVPDATAAAVYALQPGHPDAGDPWQTFERSIALGEKAGVRLPTAYYAQTAATVGAPDRLADAIARDAASRAATQPSAEWSMLDEYARLIVQHESDRLWMQAEGHRTPADRRGQLPKPAGPVGAPPPPPGGDVPLGDLF